MTGKRERVKEFVPCENMAEGKKEGVGKGDQKLSWRGGRSEGGRASGHGRGVHLTSSQFR